MAKHGLSKSYPCYLANAPIPGASELDVPDQFTGKRATRVGFGNPAQDVPQRIIYWKDGADLRARIEGTNNGKAASQEWRWSPAK